MPSGKTHDAITFLFVAPTFAATWQFTGSVRSRAIVTVAFLFGGLMFGPDLDTHSKQYTRWGIFRFLWYPYQAFFKHRSRWSHGLVFGTFLRVVYFMGVLTLLSFLPIYAAGLYGRRFAGFDGIYANWRQSANFVRVNLGEYAFLCNFRRFMARRGKSHVDRYGWLIRQNGRIMEFL